MSSTIIPVISPFFTDVIDVLERPAPSPDDLPSLQRRLTQRLTDVRRTSSPAGRGLSQAEWDSIEKTLIYWADEVLTRHIGKWENYTLEWEHHSKQDRSYLFYLNAEQATSMQSRACAEVEFLAAALGFKGDIETAYLDELGRELPGGKKDPKDALKHWARQRAARVIGGRPAGPDAVKLRGHREPLPDGRVLQAAVVAAVFCALVFLVVVGWWFFGRPGDI